MISCSKRKQSYFDLFNNNYNASIESIRTCLRNKGYIFSEKQLKVVRICIGRYVE